ncbi:MAG: hypothetical protein QXS19_08695 [Candidatus Methanomethylicia archaeon]
MSKTSLVLEQIKYKTSQPMHLYIPSFVIIKSENIVKKDLSKYYIDYVSVDCKRKMIGDSSDYNLDNEFVKYKNRFIYKADVYSYEKDEPKIMYKLVFIIDEVVLAQSNSNLIKSPSNPIVDIKRSIKIKKIYEK